MNAAKVMIANGKKNYPKLYSDRETKLQPYQWEAVERMVALELDDEVFF